MPSNIVLVCALVAFVSLAMIPVISFANRAFPHPDSPRPAPGKWLTAYIRVSPLAAVAVFFGLVFYALHTGV
jgi:hypothetical protein